MFNAVQEDDNMAIKILRVGETVKSRGRCRTTLYDDIKAGLWPTGVRIGKRAVGWPEHEADQLNAARIAGRSDEEIRHLVTALVAARGIEHQHAGGAVLANRNVAMSSSPRSFGSNGVSGFTSASLSAKTTSNITTGTTTGTDNTSTGAIVNVVTASSDIAPDVTGMSRAVLILGGKNPRPDYPRTLAVHEAGHAVATIVQGGLVDGIYLRTRRECRYGDAISTDGGSVHAARGATSATNFSMIKFGDMARVTAPIRRDLAVKDMVVLFAGPCAEIRQRHGAGRRAFDQPGSWGDRDEIEALANLLPDGQDAADEACMIAVCLVRTYWSSIQAVADAIQTSRYTPGELVTSIVRRTRS